MKPEPRWPIGTTGALWLAFLLVVGHYLAWVPAGIVTILVGIHDRREIWQAPPGAFLIAFTTAAFEIGLVLRLGMVRVARLSFAEVGWRGFAPRDVAIGLLGFAGFAVVVIASFAAGDSLGGALDYVVDKIAGYTPQQRAFFAIMGLVAAIPEETIFRGILQPTLQAKLGRWPGLILGAAIFSVYHFAFVPVLLVTHFCHGLILGLLRERTGSLWAPAIAHVLAWAIGGAI